MSFGGGHSHNANFSETRVIEVSRDNGVSLNINGSTYTSVFINGSVFYTIVNGSTYYYRRASHVCQPQIRYKCSDDGSIVQDWTNNGSSYFEWI